MWTRRMALALTIAEPAWTQRHPCHRRPRGCLHLRPGHGRSDCGPNQYTFTSGAWRIVTHANDTNPANNFQFSVKGGADNITLRDEAGDPYRLVGQWHFGGTHLANDTTPFHFGMHLRVISQGGGAVDDVSAVLTGSPFGDMWIDIGSCAPLG